MLLNLNYRSLKISQETEVKGVKGWLRLDFVRRVVGKKVTLLHELGIAGFLEFIVGFVGEKKTCPRG